MDDVFLVGPRVGLAWLTSTSVYVTGGLISLILIAIISIIYFSCHIARQTSPYRTSLYGRMHETTTRVGLRRKTIRIDPFTVTGLDILRRFEDSLAMFLYLIFNEVALSRINSYHISFHKVTATVGISPRDQQYSREYHWLVTHLNHNAREYTYLFMGVKDRKVKDAVFTLRTTPIPVSQLIPALKGSSSSHKVETIHSVSQQLREITKELLMEYNERGCGTQILEGFDSVNKDIREKVWNNTVEMIERGHQIAEILYNIVPLNTSKTIKDKYAEVTRLYNMLLLEYLPYSDVVLQNKKWFQEASPAERQEAILAALEDVTTHVYNEEVWEVLATTVLPRFRKTLANYDS